MSHSKLNIRNLKEGHDLIRLRQLNHMFVGFYKIELFELTCIKGEKIGSGRSSFLLLKENHNYHRFLDIHLGKRHGFLKFFESFYIPCLAAVQRLLLSAFAW